MIKFLIVLLLPLTLHAQDLDFIPYLSSFRNAALASKTLSPLYLKRLDSIIVRIAYPDELPDNIYAACKTEKNTIIINGNHVPFWSVLKKQELFDHEMSHCVLLRSHYNLSNLTAKGEIPVNIMHHKVFEYTSTSQMNKMRKELFNPHFYGTQLEVEKRFIPINENEVVVSSHGFINPNVDNAALRQIEHTVMEERIEKYQKNK